MVSGSRAGSEPVRFDGLLLIPAASVPPGAVEVAAGDSLTFAAEPTGPGFVFEGEGLAVHEAQGLLFLVSAELIDIVAENGERAVVGPGVYAFAGIPGVQDAGSRVREVDRKSVV